MLYIFPYRDSGDDTGQRSVDLGQFQSGLVLFRPHITDTPCIIDIPRRPIKPLDTRNNLYYCGPINVALHHCLIINLEEYYEQPY